MRSEELFVLVVLSAMASGVLLIVLALRQRAYQRELGHRERMAMIDKGLVPPPEMTPLTFVHQISQRHPRQQADSTKSLTLGIVIVAIGFGFMSIVGFAAQTPSVAVGIGGAIVIVGSAFIVIGQVKRSGQGQAYAAPPPLPTVQPSAPERPTDSSL